MRDFRHMSIAEALADRDARQAFSLATGFPDVDMDTEKAGRRSRYQRRRAQRDAS